MDKRSTDNWLDSLKPGDEVFVVGRHNVEREAVDRVTNTQIVLRMRGSRYRLSDGKPVGARSFDPPVLRPLGDGKAMRRWLLGEFQKALGAIATRAAEVASAERLQVALSVLRDVLKHLEESDGEA